MGSVAVNAIARSFDPGKKSSGEVIVRKNMPIKYSFEEHSPDELLEQIYFLIPVRFCYKVQGKNLTNQKYLQGYRITTNLNQRGGSPH